jgi:Fur family peroxide stress response transcriptional regulator
VDSSRKREQMQRFEQLCRERRLALTVQRRAILETVLDCSDHPTADDVYERVVRRVPGVSRTTVYRVLEMLVEMGLITKACSPGGASRFDPRTHRHHHLVCLHCDRLIDVEDTQFKHRVQIPELPRHAFEIQGFSIQFYGVCAACGRQMRKKRGEVARSAPPRTGKSGRTKPTRGGKGPTAGA